MDIHEEFNGLATWEQEMFIENNREQLISDFGVNPETVLKEAEIEELVLELICRFKMSPEEILDACVDDVEKIKELVAEAKRADYYDEDADYVWKGDDSDGPY